MTTIGLSYSLVKISTKCAPALGIDGELGGNIVVVGEGHALGAGAQILRCIGGISGGFDDGTTHGDTPFSLLM